MVSKLDYCLLMLPPKELSLIVRLTSARLLADNEPGNTKGEILKFFGVLLLIARFEFGSRRSLTATKAPSQYIPAQKIGEAMSRHRFDALWKNIRFSDQPATRPHDMSSEHFRWRLVGDFVTNFDDHRRDTFMPSPRICVDESISRWYGVGGDWINASLPMSLFGWTGPGGISFHRLRRWSRGRSMFDRG
jgi:hypothetical protein